jgi:hypothetical protein
MVTWSPKFRVCPVASIRERLCEEALAIIQEVIAMHIEMLQERGESLLVDQVEMAIVEANVQ